MKNVVLLSILFGTATQLRAAQYSVTDLGTYGSPFTSSTAFDLNSSGQIVGESSYVVNPPAGSLAASYEIVRPFLYDAKYRDISATIGIGNTVYAINESGQMIGQARSTPFFGAFLYRSGSGMVSLNSLISPQSGWSTLNIAYAINNSGQIAGEGYIGGGVHAFQLDVGTGTISDVGTFGGRDSHVSGINELGWVVGSAQLPGNNVDHPFLYDGTLHDLGLLGQASSSFARGSATAVNAKGQVTGYSTTSAPNTVHAFLYDGTMHDLGTLIGAYSYGLDINANGQVVGYSGPSAFVYESATGMVDLNTLIDPTSGWHLTTAVAINDAGQIIGNGTIGGEEHAYLLNPVSEPSSIIPATIGFFCLVIRRRLHRVG
jgi:probable HAF family extracellular repeat protein